MCLNWSPYFNGRMVRGHLKISTLDSGRQLTGIYTENLFSGAMSIQGAVIRSERALHLDLRHSKKSIRLLFCSFPPSPPRDIAMDGHPVSILAGTPGTMIMLTTCFAHLAIVFSKHGQ